MQVDLAAAAMWCSIKLCYYVTTAAGKVAVNWIQLCYNLRMATCAFFANLAEMEISLRESSRRNLVRIVQYSHIRAMPYSILASMLVLHKYYMALSEVWNKTIVYRNGRRISNPNCCISQNENEKSKQRSQLSKHSHQLQRSLIIFLHIIVHITLAPLLNHMTQI